MIIVPPKIPGDQLSATEYSDCTSQEAQNFVLDSGQALSGATDTQMIQAALRYQASGNEYIDSGVSNSYVLSSRIASLALDNYIDGMKVSFIATHTNTGAITVNVNGLGSKDVVFPGGGVVTTGTVATNKYITFIFDFSSDDFIFVASTDGQESDLNAYKAEIASEVGPEGSTLVGYTNQTVKAGLDDRLRTTQLSAETGPTGASRIGKLHTGTSIGTGDNAQEFFSLFVGFAHISTSGLLFGHNLTVTALSSSRWRFNFITTLPNANYIVLISSTASETNKNQSVQLSKNTQTSSEFIIQSRNNNAAPEDFDRASIYVIKH